MTKAELSNLMDELIQIGIKIFNNDENYKKEFFTNFQPKQELVPFNFFVHEE